MGARSIAASVRSVFSRTATETPPASDSGGSDSDISDDDEESMFIYSRVTDLPPTFYTTDAISSCLHTETCHCYATHGGIVHLRKPDGKILRTVRVHRASVLHIDSNSGYVATASIDGTVVIASISDPLDTVQASFRRPVHCVALHPDYKGFRSYVSGGTAGEVVLSERGWLKSRSDTILAHTDSTILALAWISISPETRVVWCNEDGVSIFCPERKIVLKRHPRTNPTMRADLYRPCIYTDKSDKTAVVSWARSLYVIDLASGGLISQQELPYMLSGAVKYKGMIALLTIDPHSSAAELKLRNSDNSEIYADELEPHKKQKLGSNDFHLAAQGGRLFVTSCNDVICARERTSRDHINWLCHRHRYLDAYNSAKSVNTKYELKKADDENVTHFEEDEMRDIGLKAAHKLVEQHSFVAVANLLSEILKPSDNNWLLFAASFLKEQQHLVIGDVLPTSVKVGSVNDEVLHYALENKCHEHLARWIKKWPLYLFDAPALAKKMALMDLNSDLLNVYAELLIKMSEYVPAVRVLIKADSPRAFGVVKHYHLWSEPEILNVLDQVLTSGYGSLGDGALVEQLHELIDVRAEIPPSKVVKQLQSAGNDLVLFGYLTELGAVDEPQLAEFADLMVEMYIRYDRSKLLNFLERFDTYDLPKTLQLCREDKELVSELVYLLGRVGESDEALSLIVTELKDYKRATHFAASMASTHGNEIWEHLIQYCKSEPQLVLELLKRVEVSAAKVLQVVPANMQIKGLKGALADVFREQETSLELSKGTKAIVNAESNYWTRALRSKRSQGVVIESPSVSLESIKPPVVFTGEGTFVDVPSFGRAACGFSDKIKHLQYLNIDSL